MNSYVNFSYTASSIEYNNFFNLQTSANFSIVSVISFINFNSI